jgi:serine protease
VSVASQPSAQTCQVTNGFGQVSDADITNVNVVCSADSALASLSGTITAAAGITVDTTVNDTRAFFADNTTILTPQPISNRATLHGFASAEGTGGDPLEERYTTNFNEDDYYQVSLQAGQVIQLQVVDFEGFEVGSTFEGDLDLYLYDSQNQLSGWSNDVTEYEEIVIAADGEYRVNVYAFSGISKYVLRILPPGDGGFSQDNLSASRVDEFVPHQMVVQLEPGAAQAQNLQTQTSNLMRFAHMHTDRPTLVSVESQVVELTLAKGQKAKVRTSRGLDALRQLNPASYEQLVTLRNIKALRQQPGVRYAEPNYLRRAFRVPNDPGYPSQWHYNTISLPQAWDVTIGNRPSGEEVIVAVIDTGIYLAHPDFSGQLLAGYDFISNPDSARDGNGIDANPDDPGDSDQRGQSSWHGTHVAGTIAVASDNNSGIAGVAWGAKLMPIRVLGKNGGTSYDVMQGVRYAAGLSNDSGTLPARRADIANLSLGGGGGSLAEQDAYQAARDTGMIIVAAAGNDNTSTPNYPAAYEGVISVSATDFANQRAPYSNFGSTISLAAPGGNIRADLNGDGYADGVLSAVADDTSGNRQPAYAFYPGTSMAAPHVAGVLALMKAVYPALSPDQVDMLIATDAITDDLGTAGRDDFYGHGLINALKSVRVASDLASGTPLPEWPPQMRATPATLNVGLAANASITISNEGGGNPDVSSVSSNRPWLTIAPPMSLAKVWGATRLR